MYFLPSYAFSCTCIEEYLGVSQTVFQNVIEGAETILNEISYENKVIYVNVAHSLMKGQFEAARLIHQIILFTVFFSGRS